VGNAGERCSRHSGYLETTTSGAKEPGREGEAHRGGDWPELWRKVAGVEVLRRRGSGARGEGCCRDSPGSGSPWIVVWGSCEGVRGIRGVRGSPATKNRGCGASHRRRLRLQFRRGRGSGVDAETLDGSLMTRWSYRSSWLELGVTGAVDPRRSRGGGMRRRRDSARAGC
jgi:hypothetical protein